MSMACAAPLRCGKSAVDTFSIEKNFLRVDGCLTYRDIDHFSECGEVIIGNKLVERLNVEDDYSQ